jgi:hypothetical protein
MEHITLNNQTKGPIITLLMTLKLFLQEVRVLLRKYVLYVPKLLNSKVKKVGVS